MPRRPHLAALPVLAALSLTLSACGGVSLPGGFGAGPGAAASGDCALLPLPPAELERPVPRSGPDQTLVDVAVRIATNRARCDRGLAPLRPDVRLLQTARGHSEDMARGGFFDHFSPVAGRSTLDRRLRLARADYDAAGENLARLPRFDFRNRRFIIRDRRRCDFAFRADGPSIEPFSYRALGERVVEGWLDSPGHRRNLLDERWTRLGTGAATLPDAEYCGEILVTQVFAD